MRLCVQYRDRAKLYAGEKTVKGSYLLFRKTPETPTPCGDAHTLREVEGVPVHGAPVLRARLYLAPRSEKIYSIYMYDNQEIT